MRNQSVSILIVVFVLFFAGFVSAGLLLRSKGGVLKYDSVPDANYVVSTQQAENQSPEKFVSVVSNDEDLGKLIPQSIEDINIIVESAKNKAVSGLEQLILEAQSGVDFESVKKLDFIVDRFITVMNTVGLLSYVHPDEKIASYAMTASEELMVFFNKQFKTPALYNLLKRIKDTNEIYSNLANQQKYFLDQQLQGLELSGCSLTEERLVKFKELENLIEKKSLEFERNIALDEKKLFLKKEDLLGVSERMMSSLPQDENGLYIVGTDYPTYFEVMKNCSVAQTREQLFNIFSNRAYPVNQAVLEEIISLRQELAQLLGMPDYASLNIVDKMAKTPQKVQSFLMDIAKNITTYAQQEFEVITQDLADGIKIGDDGLISVWDFEYQKNYYEKKYLSLDHNLVAEFFPLESTLASIFLIYQNILGLKFEVVQSQEWIWHPDVKILKVYNSETQTLMGYIFLDLFPRKGKFTHACCGHLIAGVKNSLVDKLPVMFVLANFPKPSNEAPSLLKHSDVVTFFHEFGHAMHNLLGKTEFGTVAGTNVLRDFVEAPSQMFEEWMWNGKILKQISSHYQTGQSLPDEIIESILRNRTLTLAIGVNRQVRLALFSLYCFWDRSYGSLKDLERQIVQEVPSIIRFSEASHFYASFGHLTGYGAGYYGYLWSQVFAKDLWSEIEKLGIDSKLAGEKIQSLLSVGGMKDPALLLYDVLGREPSVEAFDKYLSKS